MPLFRLPSRMPVIHTSENDMTRKMVDSVIRVSYLRDVNFLKLIPIPCLFFSLLISCSHESVTDRSVSKATASERAVGERIFSLLNAERVKVGKKALRGHRGLNELAQKQANYLSKNAKNGKASTFGSNNRAYYAKLRFNVENVTELATATSSENTASEASVAWMSSPEHRRTLLQSWSHTGIGVSRGAGGSTYITMLLGVTNTAVPRSVTPVGW